MLLSETLLPAAVVAGQIVIPIPGVGAAIGGAVGTVGVMVGAGLAGFTTSKIGGKVTAKIYAKNIASKCPLCQSYIKESDEEGHENN